MVAFLSILLAVILLSATVYGLHRYQTMEVEYNVDRSTPLPPLESDEAGFADSAPDAETEAKTSKSAARADKGQAAQAGGKTAQRSSVSSNRSAKASKASTSSQGWLNEVAELKKKGELQQAMQVCKQEFPLWGAYNQACIIERLRLKQCKDKAEQESILHRLYQLAASAELLHDKSENAEHLTPIQLKSLDLSKLAEIRHDYSEIGYAHLRLIRKSDVKSMIGSWGRPNQHQLPRQVHSHWWQTFTARIG
ncbi:MAG: hypothetical protein MRY76_03465 [Pseudomonadales bacterium]|jgi:hypothetical protein|nr:hypothetical protein [Pseudomonadales bacterium]